MCEDIKLEVKLGTTEAEKRVLIFIQKKIAFGYADGSYHGDVILLLRVI